MPLQATSGAASYDAFGGGVPVVPQYIEDVFSTYLYTGNGSTQTITNGIDLAGKGGLVWIKSRTFGDGDHALTDTERGRLSILRSNLTNVVSTASNGYNINSFNSNGFTLGDSWVGYTNSSSSNNVSWTFRKQPKFFDVVTYTGNGNASGQVISHNLASTPGFIICKCISSSQDWAVCARTGGSASPESAITYSTILSLNQTDPAGFNGSLTNFPTSTTFNTAGVATSAAQNPNLNGQTYVAYLFAHNAGGFGLTGTDNVISCGSFTTDGSGQATVSLGYEPQWILTRSTGADNWRIYDNMRGFNLTDGLQLVPNSSQAESSSFKYTPSATGFNAVTNLVPSQAYIYIAIRRGPMKVPTDATKVFSPIIWTGNGTTGRLLATGLSTPPDLTVIDWRNAATANQWYDKLRGYSTTAAGSTAFLRSPLTNAEGTQANYVYIPDMINLGFGSETTSYVTEANGTSSSMVGWNWRRAPSFFDEVCYTGNGGVQTIPHNLNVVPELIILKSRVASTANDWVVYSSTAPNPPASGQYPFMCLNRTGYVNDGAFSYSWAAFGNQRPTATNFYTNDSFNSMDNNGKANVAYLFATCAGVSKVGSYTGTGATQTINCGFTGGARFVLVKATSTTGNWVVVDTARGMVAGTDPYLNLNTTAAEVNANNIYTTTGGFQLVSSDANTNANGVSYIFLAVA
jgi:hypothetical protein